MRTKKRKMHMYQYGSTVGAAHFPLFKIYPSDTNHMLPRPVVGCRPGNFGYNVLQNMYWLKYLAKLIERRTLEYLQNLQNEKNDYILKKVNFCKLIVPKCLRICDTFFTSMIVIGNFSGSGEIPIHKDSDDYINTIVSIGGNDVIGGSTVYYSGNSMKNIGKKQYTIPFKHGRVQIGYFDEIIHGADKWHNGKKGIINFTMKKKLLKHFEEHGTKYYSQFVDSGYPSGPFQAT